MSTSRLSLVMGSSSAQPSADSEVATSLPEAGTIHLHLHVGGEKRATGGSGQPLGRWIMLLAGIAIAAAFAGGYQLGHRPASGDVSNLREPALAGLAPPEATLPSTRGGLPAIQQQLGTPPQIVLPQGATAQLTPAALGAAAPGGGTTPKRNAFGLEN